MRIGRKRSTGTCAQGPADGGIARPFAGAHQQQIAEVDADNEQNHPYSGEKKHEGAAGSAGHLLLERDQMSAHRGISFHVRRRQ